VAGSIIGFDKLRTIHVLASLVLFDRDLVAMMSMMLMMITMMMKMTDHQ